VLTADTGSALAGAYRLTPGTAVLVRPDGRVSWRSDGRRAEPREALADAVAMALGHAPVAAALAG
jgi:tRNA(Arg) A34 adenosine deaminase TadA